MKNIIKTGRFFLIDILIAIIGGITAYLASTLNEFPLFSWKGVSCFVATTLGLYVIGRFYEYMKGRKDG